MPLDSNSTDPRELVIIGAGIIGVALAEQLQHRGHQVTLVDRDSPGRGCSYGNAGHFATDVVLPLANMKTILSVPKLLLDPLGPLSIRWGYFPKVLPWLLRFAVAAAPANVEKSCQHLRALNGRSIESYDRLLGRTGLTDLMTKRGALTVYERPDSVGRNRATVDLLREYGVEIESLSGDEVRALEPALGKGVVGGLFFPRTAHTANPYRLVTALADRFQNSGGEILQEEVVGLQQTADAMDVRLSSGRSIRSRRLVIATGAWSKVFAEQLGYKVPLDTERGYYLMLPQPGTNISRPLVSFERSFVMTPMEEGLRLAGTVELGGLDAEPNFARADILFDHAQSLLPDISNTGAHRWMGFRPSLPDSLPVLGIAPHHPRVAFAFGHQHLGLTQAAITAELLADELEGKAPEIDLSPFSIKRFQ
ncbi:FAD-binding oxidoreductase [Microbulbifer sp. CAU 1566]|uniref:NAD(P)/FAD-dependent oxidoreductase n=1 Tax=Microbulbifer sp. CAU 1566 TaxID=2933269 RepID=UPI0020058D3F|nr:FAD-dependent oxidoreductase [Microbulbifer sp. CAU 1566]MCK7596716.1 FAD-binding oxidoreductase [Microbulbifer sp. CAU 1566]